ncbi:MAG: hypothetical protein ACREMJ_10935 [Gemmatimonadales bacterium]
MHIELTEMLRCPEPHESAPLVLSTGEMVGRMVRKGVVGCPVCQREYPIVDGIVDFTGSGERGAVRADAHPDPPLPAPRSPDYAQTLQALLDLSGPGGIVVLVGTAARYAEALAALMGGVHFAGVNAPSGVEERPVLSLLRAGSQVPLRDAMARGVVLGRDVPGDPWLVEAVRVLLRGRRLVVEDERVAPPGMRALARAEGLWVGEKR